MTDDLMKPDGGLRSETEHAAPSLDAQETTRRSTLGTSYRAFLTSGVQLDIDFTESVYAAIDNRDGKHRRQLYNSCRTSAWFVRHRVSGKIRIASSRCNLRWCPLCIKTKRYIMLQSLIPWIQQAKKPKFITLTLRHSNAKLSHQIESLYKFFSNLRRRPYWKRRIKGGIWFFQIKKSESDNLWHPHLHIVSEGNYLPQSELASIWCDITHGSSIVDIRAVKDVKKAAAYVSRYASAPCRLLDLSLDDALEVVDSLHGRRICGTFGTAKDVQLVPKKCPDSDEWDYMCGFTEVMLKRQKSEWFKELYRAFVQDDYCYVFPQPPPPVDDLVWREGMEEPTSFKQLTFEWSSFYN